MLTQWSRTGTSNPEVYSGLQWFIEDYRVQGKVRVTKKWQKKAEWDLEYNDTKKK